MALARYWTFVVACGLLAATGCTQTSSPPESTVTDPTATALADFNQRVEAYIALHKRVGAPLGDIDETKKPIEITGREVAIGKAISAARADAKPGAIFSPEAAAVIKKIIAASIAVSAQQF